MTLSKFSPKIIADTDLFYYFKYGSSYWSGWDGTFPHNRIIRLVVQIPLFLYPCTSIMARAQR